jgi:hypothetical protein
MENKNIKIITLGNYHTPEMKTKKRKGIEFISYGLDNNYPQFLLDLYNNEPIHNSLINSKVDYILGNGFDLSDFFVDVKNFLTDIDINKLTRKITLDYEIFGGFSLKIERTITGKIANIEYIDFSTLRKHVDLPIIFYCENWQDQKKNVKPYKIFNADLEDDSIELNKEEIYYFNGLLSRTEYPLPKYLGGIPCIETSIEINNFWLNSTKNGFFPSAFIQFNNGVPEEDIQEELENKFNTKFTGTDNAGKFIISFNDSADQAATISSFEPADLDKKFEVLNKTLEDKILFSHRVVSPLLFGIKEAGQLGGRNELIEAYELFNNTYIRPTRNIIINEILDIISINYNIDMIKIIEMPPIESKISESKLESILSEEEIRKIEGLEYKELNVEEKNIEKMNKINPSILSAVISELGFSDAMKFFNIDLKINE